ncbi:MAG: hypothetical protein KAY50_05530 [Chitinophagaceae bacterium]|nr:hypothetical protein [Chitinophagaceae bacterium]
MRTFYLLLTLSLYINTFLAKADASAISLKRITADACFFYPKESTIDTLYTNAQIRLQSVKKLEASNHANTITDSIYIAFIANLSIHTVTLKRPEENETVHFENEHLINFEHPDKYGRVTVIATISDENSEEKELSGILDFDKENKYGAGIHKLIIRKLATISAPRSGPIARKAAPLRVFVPDYELTFEIKFN